MQISNSSIEITDNLGCRDPGSPVIWCDNVFTLLLSVSIYLLSSVVQKKCCCCCSCHQQVESVTIHAVSACYECCSLVMLADLGHRIVCVQ